ncbi:MAG TPA: chemotaxis protein CheW [Caulobacteraceae bacterium]|nr:chemotaxis protein CheW [Caulobacteraceae bacterium]
MAEPSVSGLPAGAPRRFLTYRIGDRRYAIDAEQVSEVIRLPPVARVPLGPRSLLGIANLRGAVLPIASLRGLLDQDEVAAAAGSRAIVLEGDAQVGLAVDGVDALVMVDPARIETRPAEFASLEGERLSGAFRRDNESGVTKILDIRALIEAAFTPRERVRRAALAADETDLRERAQGAEHAKLVTFEVAGQEFALALESVREIVPAPDNVTAMPRSEALVLGVMAYRNSLLPLLSLRGLLGFASDANAAEREKVVVTAVGGALVGLVADRMRDVVSSDPALIETTPAMLAARAGGEARISAIYRGEGGARLISILAPDQLFRENVMARLGHTGDAAAFADAAGESAGEARQFLVFRLGADEFALPIDVVDEVTRAPDKVTRLPRTPAFLEGVVNLRGDVLPVIDQRRRFGMPPADNLEARRLVVVRTDRHRAGLIVDSVSEVLRSDVDAIEPAPDLTGETNRLVHGVIILTASERIVLLLDPAELLTRSERSLLETFQARGKGKAASTKA